MKAFLTVFLSIFAGIFIYGQNIEVQQAKHFRKTIPLRDMEMHVPGPKDRAWKDQVIRNEVNPKTERAGNQYAQPGEKDPVTQSINGTLQVAAPIRNFDGIGNVNNVYPPDTDGDVGPNHYFQMINLSFAIWDKEGNQLYGPAANSTLWQGFIGPWTGTNDGDPILLYDEEADRWLASQFAINTSDGTFWELIAISETPDPLGSWYQYAFQFPDFNDYPKFGIWHDAYYASFNIFGSDYARQAVSAFERDKMLAGDSTARMVLFDFDPGSDPFNMLPADFDGPVPATGVPNYFIYFNDDAWGYPQDQLRLWEFHVDWNNPLNSSFTEGQVLPVEAFDSHLCNAPRGRCIPQPGTSTKLEALSGRMMFRLQYRDFGTHQSMVGNHTVDVGNGHAGVRWYEFRNDNDGGGWYIYQQGTYAPDDHHRWMGSIAMNANGDIALGYTVSSDSIYPSVRYTARTADAPPGEMNIAEVELKRGTSSQGSINRWGDYSMMSVDPVDGTTFWFTQEYMGSGWKTRISSFDLTPVQAPAVYAGTDDTACEFDIYTTSASAENFNTIEWTTTGDGVFGNANSLEASYWRGTQDIEDGQVDLILTAYGYDPSEFVSDTMTLYFRYEPFVFPGNDTMICAGDELSLNATVLYYDSMYWSSNGDGFFAQNNQPETTYFPGDEDISNGNVSLSLTANALLPCEGSFTADLNLTIDECTFIINNPVDENGINIIPNPNEGVFEYEAVLPGIKSASIEVIDNNGHLVFKDTGIKVPNDLLKGKVKLNRENTGIYHLRIITKKQSISKIFIVK